MKTLLTVLSLSLLLTACSDITSAVSGKEKASKDSITIDGMTLEYANMPDEPLEKPLEIVKEPKVVAMTSTMTVAVKADGTLWTWGSNANGELLRETKTREEGYTPGQVDGVTDAVAVAASGGHVLVLKKDGTVWGWGTNGDGQINPNIKSSQYRPLLELTKVPDIKNVVDIAAGWKTSFFVTKKGDVYFLGDVETGFSGVPPKKLTKPSKIDGFSNIVRVDGSGDTILALDSKGSLFSSGLDGLGIGRKSVKPLKINENNEYYKSGKISFETNVIDFSDGHGSFALLDDGSMWSWNDNGGGRAAQKQSQFIQKPKVVNELSKVKALNSHAASTSDGDVFIWGSYAVKCGSCIATGSKKYEFLSPIKIASNINVLQFLKGDFETGFIDTNGYFWSWGSNRTGTRGTGEVQPEAEMPAEYLFTPEKSLWNYYS